MSYTLVVSPDFSVLIGSLESYINSKNLVELETIESSSTFIESIIFIDVCVDSLYNNSISEIFKLSLNVLTAYSQGILNFICVTSFSMNSTIVFSPATFSWGT